MTPFQERYLAWTRRVEHTFLGFYTEHWRNPEVGDPDYERLVEKYGDQAPHYLDRTQLLDEVLAAAAAVLYTVDNIERLLSELQTDVDEHVPRWSEGEPWPEFGSKVFHPHVRQASFEFANLLGWLRGLEERFDRRHPHDRDNRAGLLPALADRPLRARVENLVRDFRATIVERPLANYVLHAGVVPSPLGGVRLTQAHEISLRVPDRSPTHRVDRWLLSYQDQRDALTFAREAGRHVEVLIDNLLDAFDRERRAIDDEREPVKADTSVHPPEKR